MHRMMLRFLILTTCLASLGLAGYDEDADRGVARISLMNGDVSVRRGDSGDWVAAAVNAPLVVEDHLLTGAGSRAEVQFDWANMMRLAANTEIRLAELESQRYIIQVATGTVTFRVQRDSEAGVEISTPSVSVRPLRKGSYRITVRQDGESEITVRSGEAEVFTPSGVERLRSGKTMLARGSPSDPEFQIVQAIARDSWDRWNESRDKYLARSTSYRYVHSSVYGVEDLDNYGHWVHVAPYGRVWSPRVAAGWAPYHHGRWAWLDWYGWTWVSYDPWGWAPFHYGRWFYSRPYGWCWYPGGRYAHHYWRPGLVAFFGWGRHRGFRFGIGFGHIGWVPLAPYEPYYPWYGHRYYRRYRHNTYIDNSVNIVNNTNIVNVYRNARIRNAVTAADGAQFARGSTGNLVRVSGNELRRVGLVKGQLPVVPDRTSLRFSNRELRAGNLPRSADRRFFSRRQPARVERVPFDQQRRGMERVARGTFEPAAGTPGSVRATRAGDSRGAASQPVRGAEGNLVRTSGDRRTSTGWRRTGQASGAEVQERGSSGGWRQFGEPIVRRDSSGRGATPKVVDRSRTQERIQRGEGSVRGGRASQDSSPWRRFGQSSGSSERPQQTNRRIQRNRVETPRSPSVSSSREASPGWRRFEISREAGQGARTTGRGAEDRGSSTRRQGSERSRGFGSPRYQSPPSSSSRSAPRARPQSIRISPPIVRQRSTPRSAAPRSAPRVSAPRTRSGSPARSAPRAGGQPRGGSAPRSSGGSRVNRGGAGSGRSR
jgi:hypothetical protein